MPVLRTIYLTFLTVFCIAAPSLSGATQQQDSSDVVVRGELPRLNAGQWLIEEGSWLSPKSRPIRGARYRVCLGDEDFKDAFIRLVEAKGSVTGDGCQLLNLRVRKNRIDGVSQCFNYASIRRRVTGRFTEKSVAVRVSTDVKFADKHEWQDDLSSKTIEARWTGACDPALKAQPKP